MHPYQDPGCSVSARVEDLLARMTLEEKAGQLFHAMAVVGPGGGLVQAGQGGGLPVENIAEQIAQQQLSHFSVMGEATPRDIALWHNTVQELARSTRLGIPITLSSDPRHGFVSNPLTSSAGDGFSQWPEPPGLAATRDLDLVRAHADVVRRELSAVGIRVLLGPMADLASDPRWARTIGTFGADADLVADLVTAYVQGLQGPSVGPTSVAAMLKHFPGAGPQKDGEDAHFPYGREQVYPSGRFDLHLAPFIRALAAGVSQVMPYYAMPIGLDGVDEVGFGYNRAIVTDLLREKLGFEGIVCTDWGLVTDGSIFGSPMPARAWGVEHLDRLGRVERILDAGCDQLGGECSPELVVELVRTGRITEERLDRSVRRLLAEKFRLGLFDQRTVDVDAVDHLVGTASSAAAGTQAQRRSVVVLTNGGVDGVSDGVAPQGAGWVLPLPSGVRVYVEGVDPAVAAEYGSVVDDPAAADVAILRVGAPFEPRTEGFEVFFHAGSLEFPVAERDRILAIAAQVPVVLDVFLDRPAVVAPFVERVCALVGDFGANDRAVLDVLFGRAVATGRLPFDLPASMTDVRRQREDEPFDAQDPSFRFGDGLSLELVVAGS